MTEGGHGSWTTENAVRGGRRRVYRGGRGHVTLVLTLVAIIKALSLSTHWGVIGGFKLRTGLGMVHNTLQRGHCRVSTIVK